MQVIINTDPIPGIVEACNYGYIYAIVLSIICFASTTRAISKKDGSLTLAFIQFIMAAALVLSFNVTTQDIKLLAAKTGFNATLSASVENATCLAPTACQCVAQCANYNGWLCDNSPCFINYTLVPGITQCAPETVPCYNQTVISSLSFNNKIYLYENATYSYALPPDAPQDHWIKFYPWAPTVVVDSTLSPMFGISLLMLAFIVLDAYVIMCVKFNTAAIKNTELNFVYKPPYKI